MKDIRTSTSFQKLFFQRHWFLFLNKNDRNLADTKLQCEQKKNQGFFFPSLAFFI